MYRKDFGNGCVKGVMRIVPGNPCIYTVLYFPYRAKNFQGSSRSRVMDFRQARRRAVEQGEQNKRRLEGILEKVQYKWDHIFTSLENGNWDCEWMGRSFHSENTNKSSCNGNPISQTVNTASTQVHTLFLSFFSRTKFGLLESKHHCRVCGHVICTGCSLFLPIRLGDDTIEDVRLCPTCHSIVFRPPSSLSSASIIFGIDDSWPIQAHYNKLQKLRHQIDDLLDQYTSKLALFNERFVAHESLGDSWSDLRDDISTAKETLLLVMGHFDQIALTIRDLPYATSSTESPNKIVFETHLSNLQSSICKAALDFSKSQRFKLRLKLPEDKERLHRVASAPTLTKPSLLSSLPLILQSANQQFQFLRTRRSPSYEPISPSHKQKEEEVLHVSVLPKLLQQLDALLTQHQHLELQINLSKKLDERETLRYALEDLDKEILRLQHRVSQIQTE